MISYSESHVPVEERRIEVEQRTLAVVEQGNQAVERIDPSFEGVIALWSCVSSEMKKGKS